MPETQRYVKYANLANKSQIFTATYIKNGLFKGTLEPTMLFINVCIDGEEILDHVWVRDKSDFHKRLRNKQHKTITFFGRLRKISKVKNLTMVKDLGLNIKKLL